MTEGIAKVVHALLMGNEYYRSHAVYTLLKMSPHQRVFHGLISTAFTNEMSVFQSVPIHSVLYSTHSALSLSCFSLCGTVKVIAKHCFIWIAIHIGMVLVSKQA